MIEWVGVVVGAAWSLAAYGIGYRLGRSSCVVPSETERLAALGRAVEVSANTARQQMSIGNLPGWAGGGDIPGRPVWSDPEEES